MRLPTYIQTTSIKPVLIVSVLLTLLAGTEALAAPGDITLASTSDSGTTGNDYSLDPSLSADGTVVAFWSFANNLDPGDTDRYPPDVYVKDLVTGDIALASTSDGGVKGNDYSLMPSLSADGTRVAFSSDATNLYPGDSTWVDVYVKEPGGAGPLGPGAAPSPKEVSLKAKPKKVEKGDKTKPTVLVSPCGGHEGDMVDIYKGSKKIATKTTDSACSTKHRVKMHKTAKFQAISPVQDADHLAGTSTKVRVKVT